MTDKTVDEPDSPDNGMGDNPLEDTSRQLYIDDAKSDSQDEDITENNTGDIKSDGEEDPTDDIKGLNNEDTKTSKSPMDDKGTGKGLADKNIKAQLDDSLGRLGTDRLDVYFCHCFDRTVPMEETLKAMKRLPNPPRAIVEDRDEFDIYYQLKINTGQG